MSDFFLICIDIISLNNNIVIIVDAEFVPRITMQVPLWILFWLVIVPYKKLPRIFHGSLDILFNGSCSFFYDIIQLVCDGFEQYFI